MAQFAVLEYLRLAGHSHPAYFDQLAVLAVPESLKGLAYFDLVVALAVPES